MRKYLWRVSCLCVTWLNSMTVFAPALRADAGLSRGTKIIRISIAAAGYDATTTANFHSPPVFTGTPFPDGILYWDMLYNEE